MKVFKGSLVALVALTAITISSAGFAKKPAERVTIYDVAQTEGFSVLSLALSLNPGIETVLSGNGQYTVFAPTDAAFESLAAVIDAAFCYGSVVELALAEPEYLTDVLLYHVAKGRMDSTEVLPKSQIRMLSGEFLTIEELTEPLIIDAVDVGTDNGIIHVISQVLLPSLPPSACQ